MRVGVFTISFLFLYIPGAKALEPLNTRGFFNTGATFSTTKWLYEEGKWGISNKLDFRPLTNIGLTISSDLHKDIRFQSQVSNKLNASDTPFNMDYSFLKIQKSKFFNISVGRLRNESLFYSETESEGINHPWVVTPGEVYSVSRIDHYEGAKVSGFYTYKKFDLAISLISGSSDNYLSTGSHREHLGLMGFLFKMKHPLVEAQLSYSSYRTNDPDIYWSERKEGDFTLSVKSEYKGAVFMFEYVNHIDKDPSEYIARSIDTYNRASIVENQAQNTNDEEIREMLENQVVTLEAQAELEAAANDFEAYHATLGYHYLDYFGYLTYAASDGVKKQAWAYHGKQNSVSVGVSYKLDANIMLKSQISTVFVESGHKGLFNSPYQESPILENSSESSSLDSGTESIYSFAVNVRF